MQTFTVKAYVAGIAPSNNSNVKKVFNLIDEVLFDCASEAQAKTAISYGDIKFKAKPVLCHLFDKNRQFLGEVAPPR